MTQNAAARRVAAPRISKLDLRSRQDGSWTLVAHVGPKFSQGMADRDSPRSIRARDDVDWAKRLRVNGRTVKKAHVVRAYYVLPCCLLLLNLVNNVVSYKAEMVGDPYARVALIMVLVLFGGSLVAFAIAPALEATVRTLHQGSRRGAGILGEIFFLTLLGVLVFWLYFQFYMHGPEALLPREFWNPKL